MHNLLIIVPSLLLALLTLSLPLNAVDIESAKELECIEINKTMSLNMTWVMSQKIWYSPLMNRLDLYYTGVGMSGKSADDLTEDVLYYDFCVTFEIQGEKFVAEGFEGIKQTYGIRHIKGLEVFQFRSDRNEEDFGATCYVILTDNTTFIVDTCCMPGNQMTWGMMSTVKQLPDETAKEIHDHVESLGFKRKYFTGLRYDHCKNGEKGLAVSSSSNVYCLLGILTVSFLVKF